MHRTLISISLMLIGCRAPTSGPSPSLPSPLGPAPPAAKVLEGRVSAEEARHLQTVRWIHEGSGIITRFRESGALADSVEWIVPGPSGVLPFAGRWVGLSGIAEFARRLDATMRYDRVELREYLASANSVGAVFIGEGVARATGRPFRSEILRLYTFDEGTGKIIRVRNYYDTAAYVAAVRGD